MAAWMGGDFGGEWVHVYVWLSPLLSSRNYHNIVNWLCTNKNKKLKKKLLATTKMIGKENTNNSTKFAMDIYGKGEIKDL